MREACKKSRAFLLCIIKIHLKYHEQALEHLFDKTSVRLGVKLPLDIERKNAYNDKCKRNLLNED